MQTQIDDQYKNIGIMLIDDEASVCAGHSYTLRYQYGFNNISVFTSPVEALRALEEDGSQVEVILLDLRMPDIHGLEMLARIKEINPLLQVIILSVLAADDDILSVLKSTNLVFQENCAKGNKKFAVLKKGDKADQQRLAKIICQAYDYQRSLNA